MHRPLILLGLTWLASAAANELSCDNEWTKAVFLRSPQDASYFQGISGWDAAEYSDWVLHDLSKAWIPSAVFLGIALASLLFLVTWRLVSFCCSCCRPNPRNPLSKPPVSAHVTTPGTQGSQTPRPPKKRCRCCGTIRLGVVLLQVFIALLAIAAGVVTVWGITAVRKGQVSQGWEQVSHIRDYINLLTGNLDTVLVDLSSAYSSINNVQNALQNTQGVSLPADTLSQVNQLKSGLSNTVRQYNDSTFEIRNSVVGKLSDLQNNHESDTEQFDEWRYYGSLVIFAVGLFFLVALCLAMLINCPALFTMSTVFIALIVVLYFALAASMAVALAGGNDACPAMETIAISFMGESPMAKTMAEYYFYNPSQSLSNVLAQADIIDIPSINDHIITLLNLLRDITSSVTNPQPSLTLALRNANNTLNTLVSDRNQLLLSASAPAFNIVYGEAKGYVCCTVPDQYVKLWYAFTFAGWAMLLMTWLACALIAKYNAETTSHKRCGWVCIGPLRVHDHTHPEHTQALPTTNPISTSQPPPNRPPAPQAPLHRKPDAQAKSSRSDPTLANTQSDLHPHDQYSPRQASAPPLPAAHEALDVHTTATGTTTNTYYPAVPVFGYPAAGYPTTAATPDVSTQMLQEHQAARRQLQQQNHRQQRP